MTHGADRQGMAGERLGAVAIVDQRRVGGWRDRRGEAEELPTAGQLGLAMASAEEAVASNAVEAGPQHVEQKATDELPGGKRHGLLRRRGIGPLVPIGEADLITLHVEQPVIGDRHAVRVAPDVVDDPSCSGGRRQGTPQLEHGAGRGLTPGDGRELPTAGQGR